MTFGRPRRERHCPTLIIPSVIPPLALSKGNGGIIIIYFMPYHCCVRSRLRGTRHSRGCKCRGDIEMSVYPSHQVCLFLSSLVSFPPFPFPILVSRVYRVRLRLRFRCVPHLPPRTVRFTVPYSTLGLLLRLPGPDPPHCDPIATSWDCVGCCTVELRAFYHARHLHIDIPIHIPHPSFHHYSLFPSLPIPRCPRRHHHHHHRPSPPSREMLPAVA
jgi:hypothetical protein